MNAFADTSALYAVLDAADDWHERARESWRQILSGGHPLHTTSYVLVETAALLQSRIGMDAVGTLVADVLPVLSVFWVDEATHRSAQHAHLVSARRELSLVDCVSFEVMRRLHLRDAFSFDQHFAQQGFRLLPGDAA